jgi:hypothetical protein
VSRVARKERLDVVQVFTDNDLSSCRGKRRHGYETLTEAVHSGRVDAVIVWHPRSAHPLHPRARSRPVPRCLRTSLVFERITTAWVDELSAGWWWPAAPAGA